jgi:hypothetical protein
MDDGNEPQLIDFRRFTTNTLIDDWLGSRSAPGIPMVHGQTDRTCRSGSREPS